MISIFLGLTAANVILLFTVFVLGLLAIDPQSGDTWAYLPHILLAIMAGLMTLVAHITTYTYFMATTKWLTAASEQGGIDESQFVPVAKGYKRRVFGVAMSAIGPTMIAMFAGAGADPLVVAWWPGWVHMILAIFAIWMNIRAAIKEYAYIGKQQKLMDGALGILNANPEVVVQQGDES